MLCGEVWDLCWNEEGFGIRLTLWSSSTEDIRQRRSVCVCVCVCVCACVHVRIRMCALVSEWVGG